MKYAPITFGSVCSGIEAASVAWHPLGWRAAWLAEIEAFPCAVLAHHYPDVPNLGDMTTIARRALTGEVPAPDVFCGGTPCQAFSVAGLRNSLDDTRGNLTLKFVEIADAIDHVRVRRGEDECIVFWENVPGVLNTKDNAFGCFLAGLAGEDEPLVPPGKTPKPGQPWKWANAGAVYGPRRAVAWRTLDAQYFGVAQRRRRVFVVASARKGFDPAAVLFEWDGVRRDSAPNRSAREVAPTIPARSSGGGGLGTDFDLDGGLIQAFGGNNQSGPIDVATALNACASASASGRMDFETETFLVQPTRTLRGEGFDASEDGTGRGAPLVPVAVDHYNGALTGNVAATLSTGGATTTGSGPSVMVPVVAGTLGANHGNIKAEHAWTGQLLPVAFPANLSGTQCASTENLAPAMGAKNPTAVAYGIRTANTSSNGWGIQEEVTHTLDCAQGVAVAHVQIMPTMTAGGPSESSHNQVSGQMRDAYMVPVAYTTKLHNTASNNAGKIFEERTTALDANSPPPALLTAMQVRRLTPEECEALQGFPRGYTRIPWKLGYWPAEKHAPEVREAIADQCPDGPRYKALGNSWAVPNVAWIGRRIDAALRKRPRPPDWHERAIAAINGEEL